MCISCLFLPFCLVVALEDGAGVFVVAGSVVNSILTYSQGRVNFMDDEVKDGKEGT